ncbi:MAG: biotin--[acetyl-CoA-carboxylase] ligase [Roseovarius sp.]|nr:biotin--[acetyl-CoA-carboxylase] ligase [Roseovarius sp.]
MSIRDDWPRQYGRRVLKEIDSTNAEAMRIARATTRPEWILALRQNSGRGRRGRAWAAPEGNFSATLLLHLNESPGNAALRSFVASLALFDAVAEITGRIDGLSLKWPNDLLLNGGKLAGILLESAGTGGNLMRVAIGIGVNLFAVPRADEVEERSLEPVSLMSQTGISISPEDFLDALAPAYARHERQFARYGFDPARTAWLNHAARLGEVITARTGGDEITGRFETVDKSGNLVLLTSERRHSIPAAEIFF